MTTSTDLIQPATITEMAREFKIDKEKLPNMTLDQIRYAMDEYLIGMFPPSLSNVNKDWKIKVAPCGHKEVVSIVLQRGKHLEGQRFGRLLVVKFDHVYTKNGNTRKYWNCLCDCGGIKIVPTRRLTSGETQSCGCLIGDTTRIRDTVLMEGQRFGRLVVIAKTVRPPQGNKCGQFWLCKCDCGKQHVAWGANLRSGGVKSCGCLKRITKLKGYGVASFNVAYTTYQKGAFLRNIPFELTEEEFKKIAQQNCYYCDSKPMPRSSRKLNGEFIYTGIDRLNSEKGYTNENCVPCCKVCNYAKRDVLVDNFLKWIVTVYNHLGLCEKLNSIGGGNTLHQASAQAEPAPQKETSKLLLTA